MNNSKVWFITGAGRGMGVDIAKAALAAGHKVVATGRNIGKVADALGESRDLALGQVQTEQGATRARRCSWQFRPFQPTRFIHIN